MPQTGSQGRPDVVAAEIAKIRSLPTPRNALLVAIGLMVVASLIVLIVQPGGTAADGSDYAEWYYGAPELAGQIGGSIAAMVLGAWVIGVEFASKTVRLAATVQPARLRFVATKLLVALGLLAAFAAVVLGVTMGLQALMSSIGGVSFPAGKAFDAALGSAVLSLLWGGFAFGLVLALRSYTAGLIAAIVLAIGVDNLLQLIPRVGDYTFGSATSVIFNAITDAPPGEIGTWTALATVAAWIVGITLAGTGRFVARDLK